MADDKNKIAEKFAKMMSSVDMSGEADFINDLIDVVTEPAKKIPEPVFKEIFLPYFLGEKKMTREENAVAHWIGLVGSASESADVVNAKGEVLFKVPPMVDTDRINKIPAVPSSNLSMVFSNYEDDAKVHAGRAKMGLAHELAVKSMALAKNNPNAITWEPVLRHYKLLPEQQQGSNKLLGNDDEDLIFGDD